MLLVAWLVSVGSVGCPHEAHIEPTAGMAAASVNVVFDSDRGDGRLQVLVDGRQARLSGTWSLASCSVDTFVRMRPGWRHVQVTVTTTERRCREKTWLERQDSNRERARPVSVWRETKSGRHEIPSRQRERGFTNAQRSHP